MGSWSINCGVSQIAITAGDECVLIPLLKNKYQSYNYFTHKPLTLPIFGTYDDYGSIENIQKDENTRIIEEFFGLSIEEFVTAIVDGPSTYNRDDAKEFIEKSKHGEILKSAKFMWINREVYDYMSNLTIEPGSNLPMGSKFILEGLGFKCTKRNNGKERYNQTWQKDTYTVFSDGTFLSTTDGGHIYSVISTYGGSDMITFMGKTPEVEFIGSKTTGLLYDIMSTEDKQRYLFSILSGEHEYSPRDVLKISSRLKELLLSPDTTEERKKDIQSYLDSYKDEMSDKILDVYYNEIDSIAESLGKLLNFSVNLRPMSGDFKPYTLYLTPQCGEHRNHQMILEKFAEINKSLLSNDDE